MILENIFKQIPFENFMLTFFQNAGEIESTTKQPSSVYPFLELS